MDEAFSNWLEAVWERQSRSLTFPEIRKGVQALSDVYVHKRAQVRSKALDGAGKRAAFAAFYSPLHWLVVRHLVEQLGLAAGVRRVVDLGCGTAASGIAWASACSPPAEVAGLERNAWAAAEARWNLATWGLNGRIQQGDLGRGLGAAGAGAGVLCAWTVNELDDAGRGRLLGELTQAAKRGARVLIVEPIAKTPVPWWDDWGRAFTAAGGRADTWAFRPDLPQRLRDLDKAAGLNHQELRCRSLTSGGRPGGPP